MTLERTLLSAAALALLLTADIPAQTQGPIRFVLDCHCDPTNNAAPVSVKQNLYNTWITNLNWFLDQCDTYGAQVSFLSVGWWMEFVVAGGNAGPGAAVLRRIYDHGGQIGTHQHSEYRAGANNWPNLPPNASFAQIQSSWSDHIGMVNSAIDTAYAGSPPEALSVINNVRGSHVPNNEPDYHAMMQFFGITVRQGGPEEDYSFWYGHHIWNPYRPSPLNYMDEDLTAPFVVTTQGSTIGLAGAHHGIYQDMTVPQAKRQFLQLYLNWRYRDRFGLPERVWTWGWGGHPSDYDPADPSRPALVDMLAWINLHFRDRIEPTGSDVLAYSTQRAAAAEYVAWEAAHPGVENFGGHALAVDWAGYPYLRAVAEEMNGFGWVADLAAGAGVEAYQLRKGAADAVVLWRASGTSTVDLSAVVGPFVRVVGLESGLLLGADPSAVTVGQEPLLVTEEVERVVVTGVPALGSTITVRLNGTPGTPGQLWVGLGTSVATYPHLGTLLLDLAQPFALVAQGPIPAGGLPFVFTVPNDPAWLGVTGYFQGLVTFMENASARLSIDAPSVTIN